VAVYSISMGAASITGPGSTTVFTVPADGTVYILRDVLMANRGSSSGNINFYVVRASVNYYVLIQDAMPSDEVLHFDGRQVLLAGDELVLFASASTASVLASGYNLL
jgi:hypothetical protein